MGVKFGDMTVKQLAQICKSNKHCADCPICADCPMFHYKHLCDKAKGYTNIGESEVELLGKEEKEK